MPAASTAVEAGSVLECFGMHAASNPRAVLRQCFISQQVRMYQRGQHEPFRSGCECYYLYILNAQEIN